MLFKLKDGRLMGVVMMGENDKEGPTTTVMGIDVNKTDKDLFGKPVIDAFSLNDVAEIYGAYSFAPVEYTYDYLAANKERLLNKTAEKTPVPKQEEKLIP